MFNVEFKKNNVPTKPGMYMTRGTDFGSIEMVTVILIPASSSYGITFDAYLADSRNRHNIAKYRVDWSDAIDVIDNKYFEGILIKPVDQYLNKKSSEHTPEKKDEAFNITKYINNGAMDVCGLKKGILREIGRLNGAIEFAMNQTLSMYKFNDEVIRINMMKGQVEFLNDMLSDILKL